MSASHTRAIWSPLPATIRLPSGLNATRDTARCPLRRVPFPVWASHSRAVVLDCRKRRRDPSGLNDAEFPRGVPLEGQDSVSPFERPRPAPQSVVSELVP